MTVTPKYRLATWSARLSCAAELAPGVSAPVPSEANPPSCTPLGVLCLRALVCHGYRPILATGRSLDEVRDRVDAIGTVDGALIALRIEAGELPPDDDLLADERTIPYAAVMSLSEEFAQDQAGSATP